MQRARDFIIVRTPYLKRGKNADTSCAEDIIKPAKNNRDVLHWRKNVVQIVISLSRTYSKIERSNMSLEVISNVVSLDDIAIRW